MINWDLLCATGQREEDACSTGDIEEFFRQRTEQGSRNTDMADLLNGETEDGKGKLFVRSQYTGSQFSGENKTRLMWCPGT